MPTYNVYCGNLLVRDTIERCVFNGSTTSHQVMKQYLAYVLEPERGVQIRDVPTQGKYEIRRYLASGVIGGQRIEHEIVVSEFPD